MHQRINFLNTNSDENLARFIPKKWIEVYDQSEKNYSPNKEIRIKTSMLSGLINVIILMHILL